MCLDASRPWLVYWILHSLDLLDCFPTGKMPQRIVETIASCQVMYHMRLFGSGLGLCDFTKKMLKIGIRVTFFFLQLGFLSCIRFTIYGGVF